MNRISALSVLALGLTLVAPMAIQDAEAGPRSSQSDDKSEVDANVKVLEQWVALHVAHDIDGLLELLTDDISIRSASGEKMPPATNKEEARHHWETIYSTFPDMKIELLSVVGQGDVVFAEVAHGGTMSGKMMHFEPTGKSYRVEGAFRFVFEGGKIKSIQTYYDPGSMLMQLGLMSAPDH